MKIEIESTNRRYHLHDGNSYSVWGGVTEEGNRVEMLVAGIMTGRDDDAAEREIQAKLDVDAVITLAAEEKNGPDVGPGTVGEYVSRPGQPRSEAPFRKKY